MKVAGTSRTAAVAIGVTIPKKPTKLIAAKTATTASTINTARIKATSRTLEVLGWRAKSLRTFPELPNF